MKCPLCGSSDIRYDSHTDEYYCGNCGYVFSPGEVDIDLYMKPVNTPLGSTFKGSGRYKKLSRINNKNDINTYRILQLQKIKNFVVSNGLPIIVYEWVVHIMKERYGNKRWRFSYIVAVLYLGVIKFGFYRSIEEFEEFFGISRKVLWKQIYEASRDLGINYVVDSGKIAKMIAKEDNVCVNCCVDYIVENVGNLAMQYGSSPKTVALSYIFLCRMYCNGDVVMSKFMKENKIPRNSLNQNIVRIFQKFNISLNNYNLKKDEIKQLVGVMMNGSGCKSSEMD